MARKRRGGGGSGVLAPAARWSAAVFGSLYLAWALFRPGSSGPAGRVVHDALFGFFGNAAYLTAPLVLYGLAIYFRVERRSGHLTWALGSLLSLASASALLSAARPGWGGTLGATLRAFLLDSVGAAGAWLLALAAWLLSLQTLFEISWREILARCAAFVAEDYREWARASRELREQIRAATAKAEPCVPAPAVEPGLPPRADAAPVVPADTDPVGAASEENAAKPRRAAKASDGNGYKPPSLDLLTPRAPGTATGPEEAEIREAIESLDRTLASFGVLARVSSYSPGPVITRYEVAPSPGVTVNSIVARSNDIALAMKARGIRMLAPIPGKAAVGIEIPNRSPAVVTLREVLESGAMAAQRGALAFAMGLSSDGSSAVADLQKLPHLLIAGATNSGKSVMTHALIQSILFRSRPDEAKLLLIDPKRIELSLYEGTPHLYDPKTPCENVGVITNSKDAARSLKALILVMEGRYEKFQDYRARDIEAFNQAARKAGRPPEFYIVVVIDELADLMVVAGDVVEDSIQRLAQMARAVGIHLVLATQRPSVDVLTGVIKANLPARIALRVASKVDSKVILDGNGAESLLGKGDMLYMAPGQEPVRIQGALVTTEEISRVIERLRLQGKPDYPTLASMAAVGEEDLTKFGVDPAEFVSALELVLERRRVSQDLLKSQFGSSARATNLLSLLEVKRFIHKPEGTNRWEIDFGQIEDYLKARRPLGRLGAN